MRKGKRRIPFRYDYSYGQKGFFMDYVVRPDRRWKGSKCSAKRCKHKMRDMSHDKQVLKNHIREMVPVINKSLAIENTNLNKHTGYPARVAAGIHEKSCRHPLVKEIIKGKHY